jgi:aminoglycoside phosphotransferase (APT) family kinase protein
VFNQSNLFVNENTYEIVGVIDWEEAVFGDPVYDFARFHLHLWHRDVSMEDKKLFFELLDFNEEEKNREEIYFKLFIVHYLAYYSESDNGFSLGRIKMHEEFLKNNL